MIHRSKMLSSHIGCRLLLAGFLMAGFGLGVSGAAFAQEPPAGEPGVRLQIDIQGQSLETVLAQLITTTPIDIVYDLETVRGHQTACRYQHVPTEAFLDCLLEGTGISVERLASGTFILREQPQPPAPASKSYLVHGRVYDAETGEPLPNAAVYLPAWRQGGVTDTTGYYRLVLTVDSALVTVSHLGYRGEEFEVQGRANTERGVGLVATPLTLGTLDVTAFRDSQADTTEAVDSTRALYLHEEGYFAGLTTRSLELGTLVGYRWKGKLDVAFYLADQFHRLVTVGPMVGYASRPLAKGWGFQASLLYRFGIGDGGGRTLVDRGMDVTASVYKRMRLRGATIFPSLGGFVHTSELESADYHRAVGGLRASVPFVLKVSDNKQLILEPTFQFSDHFLGRYEYYNFPGLDIRLNF